MPLAGMAAGSSDALQALLLQAFQRKQLEEELALKKAASARQDAAQGLQEQEFNADQAYRTGQVERQGRLDRQAENQRGVSRMMGDFLMQRGATPLDQGARNQLMGMGISEGVDVPNAFLVDPGQAQRERIELENLRSKNDLDIEAVRGKNTLAAATARQAGTRDAAAQRRIDQVTKGFDSQPTVRRVQVLSEAAQFARSLNPNTTNPQDDQALIYGFAKAMDPESVVREGEYATVQKYSQSWANKFGFDVARIFSNTPFLTPDARANMKATILQRFNAARGSYDNLRKSYGAKLAGMGGDESDLIDYGAGFPQVDGAPQSATGDLTWDPATKKWVR